MAKENRAKNIGRSLPKVTKSYNADKLQVKYGNQINTIAFKNFNRIDFNIFFSILAKMKDQGTDIISIPFSELEKLTGYDPHGRHSERFYNLLKNTYDKKITELKIYHEDDESYDKWVLFDEFKIWKKKKRVDVGIDQRRVGLLNNFAQQWTRYRLQEFNNLNSTYAKTIYRLCKQYRTQGGHTYDVDEFRRLLDIPKTYKTNNIDARILKPAKKELRKKIKNWSNFNYAKIKSKKRGSKIVAYRFTFRPEARDRKDFENKPNNQNYRIKYASNPKKKKVSRNYKKIYPKEDQKKIGVGKRVHKTSNNKAREVYKEFRNH